MKKNKRFNIMLLAAMLAMPLFVACGGDDDDDAPEQPSEEKPGLSEPDVIPVGYWEITQTRNSTSDRWTDASEGFRGVYCFDADGTYRSVLTGIELEKCTYTVKGSSIYIDQGQGRTKVIKVLETKGNDLRELAFYSTKDSTVPSSYAHVRRTVDPLPANFDPAGKWKVTHTHDNSGGVWEEVPEVLDQRIYFQAPNTYIVTLNGAESRGTYTLDGRTINITFNSNGNKLKLQLLQVLDESRMELVLYESNGVNITGYQRLERFGE